MDLKDLVELSWAKIDNIPPEVLEFQNEVKQIAIKQSNPGDVRRAIIDYGNNLKDPKLSKIWNEEAVLILDWAYDQWKKSQQ